MLGHVGKQSGQSLIAIFLSLSILFGAGIGAFQLAGMGLRSWQLEEAATAGRRHPGARPDRRRFDQRAMLGGR